MQLNRKNVKSENTTPSNLRGVEDRGRFIKPMTIKQREIASRKLHKMLSKLFNGE